jgi:hypothetical protein
MKLAKKERQQKLKDRETAYYSLRNGLDSMKYNLNNLRKGRGHSSAFKMLDIAIDLMLDQVNSDYNRYVRRISRMDSNEDVSFMQKALNREKEKNTILEKKIEEAKTSSGLFIDFVREKLGMK